MTTQKKWIRLDGRFYRVTVSQQIESAPDVPRLIIPAYMPNQTAQDILRVCIRTIQTCTTHPYELWVVDNYSPANNAQWLLDEQGINVIISHTAPIPPDKRRWRDFLDPPVESMHTWGSYNNATGIELMRRCIPATTKWLMTLHMDTMVTAPHWLDYLLSKCNDSVRLAGVRMDTVRVPEGILHVLGFIVDYQLLQELNLDYFPDLPGYDVGDLISVKIRDAGYEFFACPNTLWQPELINKIDPPFHDFAVDRALDDDGQVIFLHLGRGVRKSNGLHVRGTLPEEWVTFAETHLLNI